MENIFCSTTEFFHFFIFLRIIDLSGKVCSNYGYLCRYAHWSHFFQFCGVFSWLFFIILDYENLHKFNKHKYSLLRMYVDNASPVCTWLVWCICIRDQRGILSFLHHKLVKMYKFINMIRQISTNKTS